MFGQVVAHRPVGAALHNRRGKGPVVRSGSPSAVYPEPQSAAQLSSFVCVTVARPLPWVRRVELGQAWTAGCRG